MMMGYTAVGKSTLSKKLADRLRCDIFHSAITRKQLGLSPKKQDAESFFFLASPERRKVDEIVYLANLTSAEQSLANGGNVVLDAGYFRRWQRIQVYRLADEFRAQVFIVRVLFDDQNEIKRRLGDRMKRFDESPFNETPGWETYVESLEMTELPYNDILPNGSNPVIIEFDCNQEKVRLVNQYSACSNTKKLMRQLVIIMEE